MVGINQYDYNNPLMSSVKDAKDMTVALSKHYDGSLNFTCNLLTCSHYPDKKITREKLHNEIEEFFNQDGREIESAVFYFSGHGCESNLGGYLMTQDSRNFVGGVSVNDILICANNSSIPNIIIILDCCYAGHMGTIPSLKSEMISLRNGITVLSSSNKHQTALEGLEGGLFTQALLFALNGEGADLTGKVDAISMYVTACKFLQIKYQTPTLKASVVNFPIVRQSKPRISEDDLGKITKLFNHPKQHKPLSRRYLKGSDEEADYKVEEFDLLKKFGDNQLIETPDRKPLEQTAEEALNCRLTTAGKFRFHQMRAPLIMKKK